MVEKDQYKYRVYCLSYPSTCYTFASPWTRRQHYIYGLRWYIEDTYNVECHVQAHDDIGKKLNYYTNESMDSCLEEV